MLDVDLLAMLKVDLGISANVYDDRLAASLQAAKESIQTEGITLTDSTADSQLVIQYAAWTWRKRDTGDGMPRMLRWALNNRLFSEKMREETDADG